MLPYGNGTITYEFTGFYAFLTGRTLIEKHDYKSIVSLQNER